MAPCAALAKLAHIDLAEFRINPRASISNDILSSCPESPRILSGFAPNRWSSIRPASQSLHGTALRMPEKRLPALGELETIKESLRKDEMRQWITYAGSSLRNTIPLPETPQHKKFCCEMTGAPTRQSRRTQKDAKHSMKTLQTIFERLAEPDAISHRKFLASMFQDKELAGVVEVFTAGLHVPQTDDENVFQEAKRKAMVKKILRILKEVDKDGSGSTEFDEFVEFFRKAEVLLEYRSEKAQTRNRVALHAEVEALRNRQELTGETGEKDLEKADVMVKASNVGRRASFRLQLF
mmetsp:Transcript_88822/g.141443  ORF Transcript_88822/g.141443 Transcript_88822/m.141443 type:complete len:295 (-) Transcript_88822:9-893(-)